MSANGANSTTGTTGRGVRYVTVQNDHDGQRLDNFLTRELKGVPRSLIYRLIRTGQVRVDGSRAKAKTRLLAGEEIRLPPAHVTDPSDRPVSEGKQEAVTQAIVLEEPDYLVINKPPGLAVHGGSKIGAGLIEALRVARPDEYLELVHRLDRPTSGCLLIARNGQFLKAAQRAFKRRAVVKQYLAVVRGHWQHGTETFEHRLAKTGKGRAKMHAGGGGKLARSRFEPVSLSGRASLVRITLETGRTHQIRVQAAELDYPLAGDERYGDDDFNQRMRKLGLKRLFLHSQRLALEVDGNAIDVSVPLSEDLVPVVERLKLS